MGLAYFALVLAILLLELLIIFLCLFERHFQLGVFRLEVITAGFQLLDLGFQLGGPLLRFRFKIGASFELCCPLPRFLQEAGSVAAAAIVPAVQ